MSALKHEAMDMVKEQEALFEKINNAISSGESEVAKTYEDGVMFITGGSGFIGKQLIEKTLRSTNIKKIYILLRVTDGRTLESRMTYIFQDKLYDWLRENKNGSLDKVIPVIGDITKPNLGIHKQMWSTLTDEVNIIVHSAATINFTEPLRMAVTANLRGTREMINFGKSCKNIKSFVHISTAYTHATADTGDQYIPEQFLGSPLDPDFVLKLVDTLDDETLEILQPKLLGHWPNTYSFTKALAEEEVRLRAGNLPVCIVRPAIVFMSFTEFPGWMDKTAAVNGPIGFILGASIGALHLMYGDKDKNLDIVPVDFVNNAIILACHETAQTQRTHEKEIKIYTVTGTRNPLTSGFMASYMQTDVIKKELMTPKAIWYASLEIIKNKLIFSILTWLLHLIPAYIADTVLVMIGQKPKAVRLLTKVFKQNKVYAVYMMNHWQFGDTNLMEIFDKQKPVDRLIYNCDIMSLTPTKFIQMGVYGCRKFILKDSFTKEEAVYARRRQEVFKILNVIFLTIYVYFIWRLFWYFLKTLISVIF